MQLLAAVESLLRIASAQQGEAQRLDFVAGEISVQAVRTQLIDVILELGNRLGDLDSFMVHGGNLHADGSVTVEVGGTSDIGSGTDSSEGRLS